MASLHVRKDDTVRVIAGKGKGLEGKVLRTEPSKNRVFVEKVNMIKKTQRPTQQNPNGGITEVEQSIDASNVMVVCPECNAPTRVGHIVNEKGRKKRVCKKCKKTF